MNGQRKRIAATLGLSAVVVSPVLVTLRPGGGRAEAAAAPVWSVITASGWAADGSAVVQDFDADPAALMDLFATGPGDADFDGRCDLADLNLVLENMGREYR